MCDMYSNQELAEIHFMYGKADGNAALARRLYHERYPQQQCPDRKTFVRLHYRLCEYGKFNSPGLGRGRPRSTTPQVQEEILEAVNMTSISTRRVALQVNVSHTTVWRLLKEYQLYPYHLQRVQALSSADYPARVRFCQWFLQQCGGNPNFPALVLFTDEAQFTRDGITNFHNQHVWAYENPRATVPSHHQVRFSLNMWAGIIGDRLVGPHVLVNRLTGQAYTNFLENTIPHVLEDTPLINRQHIHFLHDGAPAHFSRTAHRYLDRRFPDRWIGRVGITLDSDWFEPKDNTTESRDAAERIMQFELGWFAHPIFSSQGDYPAVMKERVANNSFKEGRTRSRLPNFSRKDVEYIQGTFDFLGLNHYTTYLVSQGEAGEYPSLLRDSGVFLSRDPAWPGSASAWLKVVPWGFRKLLVWIAKEFNNIPVFVTENGYSDHGELQDTNRINYLTSYLSELLKALHEDGCNVIGHVTWSIIDNFEWMSGYTEKFGLYFVNFTNPAKQRIAKDSSRVMADIIRTRHLPLQSSESINSVPTF
ncbi:hypothetical protein ANN_12759 [Periplaneta americana]|uniref:DUF4817 domain-containing protein n=1 Tax=Periplaneta americana TaxID=6978 RepID=A0ABQ8THG0_PERAM|nr:hypothetical protein ANN_12759 [Periplaneta americana]